MAWTPRYTEAQVRAAVENAPSLSAALRHLGLRAAGGSYCSHACGVHSKGPRAPKPDKRKVPRPSYEQLMADVQSMSYVAVGARAAGATSRRSLTISA